MNTDLPRDPTRWGRARRSLGDATRTILGCLLLAASESHGEIIIPTIASGAEGTGATAGFAGPMRLQNVYSSVNFPAGPIRITGIRFRPDITYNNGPFTGTLEQISFRFSTTAKAPNALSNQFDENFGDDVTEVYSGPWIVSTQFSGPGNGPKEFDVLLPLAHAFDYDPAKGNLLVEYRNFSSLSFRYHNDATSHPGGAASLIFNANSPNAALANSSAPGAEILQLEYSAINGADITIRKPPQSQQAYVGETVTFSAEASGEGPLRYQWFFEDAPVLSGTNSFLTIEEVRVLDSGRYYLAIQNERGSATSSVASLDVYDPQQVLVATVPEALATHEGSGASAGFSVRMRLQELYSASLLPRFPIVIRELLFRPDITHGVGPFTGTLAHIDFELSTTKRSPGGLSPRFDENHGANSQLVFSGSWTVGTEHEGPAAGPKASDVRLILHQPFLYDPAEGNLLIEYRNYSTLGKRFHTDAASGGGQGVQMIFHDGNPNAAISSAGSFAADVIKVVYSAASYVAPLISTHPAGRHALEGSQVDLEVNAVGAEPISYQWYKDETPIPGSTTRHLSIPAVAPLDAGSYHVVASNKNGIASTDPANLTVAPIPERSAVLPANSENLEGAGATAFFSLPGREQLLYDQSLFGGAPIQITQLRFRVDQSITAGYLAAAAVVSNLQVRLSTSASSLVSMSRTFALNRGTDETIVFDGDWPVYSSGELSGSGQPFDLVLHLEQPFMFDPNAGNLLIEMSNTGRTRSLLAVDAATAPEPVRRMFITDPDSLIASGDDSSAAVVKVGYKLAQVAPKIVRQPSSVTALQTSDVTLSVTASGTLPLSYEWFHNGLIIEGATSDILTLKGLRLDQAGEYVVLVKNGFGEAPSRPAILTVTPRPASRATAEAQVVNGLLVGFTIVDGGFGYTNQPAIRLVGGGGSGAQASVVVSNNIVVAIKIENPGSGYGSTPAVRIASPRRQPNLQITVRSVTIDLQLILGDTYQLFSSNDLQLWTPLGAAFDAEDESMQVEFDVLETGRYFRVEPVQ